MLERRWAGTPTTESCRARAASSGRMAKRLTHTKHAQCGKQRRDNGTENKDAAQMADRNADRPQDTATNDP